MQVYEPKDITTSSSSSSNLNSSQNSVNTPSPTSNLNPPTPNPYANTNGTSPTSPHKIKCFREFWVFNYKGGVKKEEEQQQQQQQSDEASKGGKRTFDTIVHFLSSRLADILPVILFLISSVSLSPFWPLDKCDQKVGNQEQEEWEGEVREGKEGREGRKEINASVLSMTI